MNSPDEQEPKTTRKEREKVSINSIYLLTLKQGKGGKPNKICRITGLEIDYPNENFLLVENDLTGS